MRNSSISLREKEMSLAVIDAFLFVVPAKLEPRDVSRLPWVPACAGTSALREDALFAWWKSVSEPVVGSVIEGNCVAVRRGGEQPEMNRQSVG